MSILYVNGDSHSAGAEAVNPYCFAEDDPLLWAMGRKPHPDNERASYGCQIANELGAILHCDAESASSNSRIIRTTDEYLFNEDVSQRFTPDLVIIGWSTWEREEWYNNGVYYQVTASGTDTLPENMQTQYKEWVVNQNQVTRDQCMLRWHTLIHRYHKKLQNANIPHLFFNTYSDFSAIRNKQVLSEASNVVPEEFDWEGCYLDPYDKNYTYYYWCLEKGFKTVNPHSYHFGPNAHDAWAEFLKDFYIDLLLTQK